MSAPLISSRESRGSGRSGVEPEPAYRLGTDRPRKRTLAPVGLAGVAENPMKRSTPKSLVRRKKAEPNAKERKTRNKKCYNQNQRTRDMEAKNKDKSKEKTKLS